MKKIVLSLAGVMAAAAFAPEASALPVFARQTGMACTACHFQHFPAINGFGRAFKAAGFTMMGAQEKVEGEHLSLPGTLNMAILATAGIETTNTNAPGLANSRLFVPNSGGELQIFFGGKVNDFSGWLSEFGTKTVTGAAAPAANTALSAASGKLHIMPEVAPGIHAGVTIYSIGQGAAGAMELLNTGATSIHRLMGRQGIHNRTVSAKQFFGEFAGTGAAVNVVGDKFAVTVAREASQFGPAATDPLGGAPGTLGALSNQYIRAVGMFDIAGFDSAVGIQSFSGGKNATLAGAAAGAGTDARLTVVDFQMQGKMGEMPVGLYASYGSAPVGGVGNANPFNNATANGTAVTTGATSFNIAGELGIIPELSTVQLALRQAKDGAGQTNNAVMIGATYELSMNMELSLHYTTQSGSAWNAPVGGVAPTGNNMTTFLLETLF